MKKLLLTFMLLANAAFANIEDSLIANVGKKAKVIFYAEKKEDFNEISKYDLNLLFKELRKRAEKDFKFDDEVTLKEADESLKNREANTTLTQRKWWNKMNLNVFVGVTQTEGNAFASSPIQQFNHPVYGKLTAQDYFMLLGKPSFLIGIGGFFDSKLYDRRRLNISFRYGGGFDLVGNKLKTNVNGVLFGITERDPKIAFDVFRKLSDSLQLNNLISKDNSPYKNYFSPNLYFQLMPTINLKNKRGQNTFNFGAGIKTSLNLAGLSNNYFNGYYKFRENNPSDNMFYYRNKTFQTSWIFNLGYKYINAFVQVYPDVARTLFSPKPPDLTNGQGSSPTAFITGISPAGRMNTYVAGIRFGK